MLHCGRGFRRLLLQHPRGTASCTSLDNWRIPMTWELVPRDVKVSKKKLKLMSELFPATDIKSAFKRCPSGPLPVEVGFIVSPEPETDGYRVLKARRSATGIVKEILEAMERASPVVHRNGMPVRMEERKVDSEVLRRELDKLWKPLDKMLPEKLVLAVLKAVLNCTQGMLFFYWACAQPGFTPSTVTYNGLLNMMVMRGFRKEAIRLYDLMAKPSLVNAGCGRNGESVAIIVRGLLSNRRLEGVRKGHDFLNTAMEIGIDIPDDLIHDVIKTLCRLSGKIPMSLRYFYRMKNPKDETYQLLVRTMSKEQYVYEAYNLIVSMEIGKGYPTDDVTYHLLISEFCRRKELSYAHVLLYDFIDRGRTPSVITFNTVLELLCSKGARDTPDKAWALYHSMKGRGVAPNAVTFSLVLQALSKANRVDQCLILMNEMLETGCTLNSSTGSALISSMARVDRVEEGLDLILRMRKEFKVFVEFDAIANTVYGFFRIKPTRQCLDALKKLERVGFVPSLKMHNVALSMICSSGNMKDAIAYFRQVIDRTCPDAGTFEPLIVTLCELGKLAPAYKLFQKMVQKTLEPNFKIYKALIIGFSKTRNMDQACKLLEHMFNKDAYPDEELYEAMIEGLHATGNFQARDLLRNAVKQSPQGPSELLFRTIFKLRACVRKLDGSEVQHTVDEAELVEDVPQEPTNQTEPTLPIFSDSEETDSEQCVQKAQQVEGLDIGDIQVAVEDLPVNPLLEMEFSDSENFSETDSDSDSGSERKRSADCPRSKYLDNRRLNTSRDI